MDADIDNRPVDTAMEGEGVMNRKINNETYIPPHVKQMASGKFINI